MIHSCNLKILPVTRTFRLSSLNCTEKESPNQARVELWERCPLRPLCILRFLCGGEGFFGREVSGGENSLTISDYIMNLNLFLRHGRQQQQQQQQLNPVMTDSTSNRNTNTSVMRSAVLRASHQRTNPTEQKKKEISIALK